MKPIELLWKMQVGDKVKVGPGTFRVKRVLNVKGKPNERMLDLGQGFFVILTKTTYKIGRLATKNEPIHVTKVKNAKK